MLEDFNDYADDMIDIIFAYPSKFFDFSPLTDLLKNSGPLLVYITLFYVSLHLIALAIGIYMNTTYRKAHTDKENFIWGYTYGLLHFKWIPILFAFLILSFIWGEHLPELKPIAALLILWGTVWATLMSLVGMLILRRSCLVIILASFLSPNFFLLCFNLVYSLIKLTSPTFKSTISPALKEASLSKKQTAKAIDDFEKQVMAQENLYINRRPY